MRVDVLAAAQLDMHRLRILAAEVRGAAMIVRPFIADHDRRVAIFHLAVREIAVGVEQHEGGLEPERLLQPAERRLGVLVANGARKPLGSWMFGHVSSLPIRDLISHLRSEERSVGKECVSTWRSRWSPYH